MILVIKNVSIEGPGTIGEFFKNTKWQVETIELRKSDGLPVDLEHIEAVIILGGPMNVYEEVEFPFLKDEDLFLKQAIEEEVPILGVCLGAQLLAKACGSKVRRSEKEEIGWDRVSLTKNGKRDPLFRGMGEELDVFQWHQDTFEIPEKAALLATSNNCKNQAFRFGKNAYGLQFHIEVTDKEIEDWSDEYEDNSELSSQLKAQKMLIDYYRMKERFNEQAYMIYLNFCRVIASHINI